MRPARCIASKTPSNAAPTPAQPGWRAEAASSQDMQLLDGRPALRLEAREVDTRSDARTLLIPSVPAQRPTSGLVLAIHHATHPAAGEIHDLEPDHAAPAQ